MLPWRLVLAHTHRNRTNENTPRHLPKRDTPLPSPCPSTLVPSLLLFLSSHFYSFTLPPTHFSLQPSLCVPCIFYMTLLHFDPPLCLFCASCFLFLILCFLSFSALSDSVRGVFVLWCGGHECEGVTVLRPETFRMRSIGNDTEGDPGLVTLETNFIKMNLSRGAILTAA